jgi:hypothetical protein
MHGAWADGSGWKAVCDIQDGYNASIVQEPETSFADDVAATKRVLAQQDGPCILVAHNYGGAVITEAGTDPSVVGLVYIAAHMPDAGEKESDDGKRFPSDLAKSGALKKTTDGFTYIDSAQFHPSRKLNLVATISKTFPRSRHLGSSAAGCGKLSAVGPTPSKRRLAPAWFGTLCTRCDNSRCGSRFERSKRWREGRETHRLPY